MKQYLIALIAEGYLEQSVEPLGYGNNEYYYQYKKGRVGLHSDGRVTANNTYSIGGQHQLVKMKPLIIINESFIYCIWLI